MDFMYHIPGPDEDPDDPKTNTCPLDPVLENKLNMLAALPKQVFGMLVPKELPDVKALMPYSLRLPHARDALDCKFDLMGPVSFSQDQMGEIKTFHAAMMEGPQKKKDPKKVAEELKKLTAAARKALGGDLPEPESAPQPADSAAEPQRQAQTTGQGNAEPALAADAAPCQHTAGEQATSEASTPAAAQAAASATTPEVGPPQTLSNGLAATDAASVAVTQPAAQLDTNQLQPEAAVVPYQNGTTSVSADPESVPTAATAAMETGTADDSTAGDDPSKANAAKPDEPAKPDEWTKVKEGDEEDAEDRFVSNYYVLPLKQWMDWEDPNDVMDDSFPEVDWEAVKHVKYGWKPLSTLEELNSAGQESAVCIDAMDVDEDQAVPSHSTDPQAHFSSSQQTFCTGTAEFTLLEADHAVPNTGKATFRIISRDAGSPNQGKAAFSAMDENETVISTGIAAFTLVARDSAVPSSGIMSAGRDGNVPSEISKGHVPASGDSIPVPAVSCQHFKASGGEAAALTRDAQIPAMGSTVPSTSPKGIKLGHLDPQRLANSVVVTTYNSTPYFYEGIDPVLTPESRFPADKLKLQVVFEQEEEDDFLKPKPPKESDTPTDKSADQTEASADKPKEGESAAATAVAADPTAGDSEDPDDMVAKLVASKQAATFTEYFK